MSTVVTTLKNRIAYLENESEGLARAIDSVAHQLAAALERLRPHDPDYVRQALGEAEGASASEEQKHG